MIRSGTYIGADFEMAVTDRYVITFRRNVSANLLESRLFKRTDQDYSCIGVCQSGPTESEQYKPPMWWKTAFIYHGEIFTKHQIFDKKQEIRYDRPPIYLTMAEPVLTDCIYSILTASSDGESVCVSFEDGAVYLAQIDEEFDEKALQPALPSICDDNVGTCLQLWNMGIHEEYIEIDGKSTFVGITINTSRHMYIFEITPDSIYCRAARFIATNKGVVFNQNFRQGFEAYMIENNMEARLPLSFDESLFSSDSCVWNSRSVYWSLASYNDMEITLHGCQGEIYHWRKPVKSI